MKVRTKTALVIFSTLVIGMILGALVTGLVVRNRLERFSQMTPSERFVHVFENLVGVEESNRDTVRSILEQHGDRFARISRRHHVMMADLADSVRKDLRGVLDEEQEQRLERRLEHIRRLLGPPEQPVVEPRRKPE